MCYTIRASIFSFVVNALSCVLLYTTYNKTLALLFAFVGLMQLYDIVFWLNQRPNALNFWTTKLAMMTNHLQPIVLALLIMYVEKRTLAPISKWLLIAYCIVAAVYSIYAWIHTDYTLVNYRRANGSLFWQWNYLFSNWVYVSFLMLFIATICALMLQHFPAPINYIVTAIALLSVILSRVTFKGQATGRFWCWMAGFIPVVIAFAYSRLGRR